MLRAWERSTAVDAHGRERAPRGYRRAMLFIPDELVRTTVQWRGEAGRRWLDGLPAVVRELEQRWAITVGRAFTTEGAIGFVAPATSHDGADAVLKISIVDRETVNEGQALELYDGEGAVRLFAADARLGALLLERCRPGTPLLAVDDETEANSIAADVLRQLWRRPPAEHPFDLAQERALEWSETVVPEFEQLGRPFERRLVEEAADLFAELALSSSDDVVLHQDFHHGNVLAAQRQPWLAIDPKPLVGDPAFDTGSLLRDRRHDLIAGPEPARRMARRVDQLSEELGLDRERMRAWGLAQAVELGLWSLSVGDVDEGRLEVACARILLN